MLDSDSSPLNPTYESLVLSIGEALVDALPGIARDRRLYFFVDVFADEEGKVF